jgi:allantoicase
VTVAADVSAATVTAKSGGLLEAIAEGALDTSFFTGNFPPYASVETTALLGYPSVEEVLAAEWTPLLERTALKPDAENVNQVAVAGRLSTHVRLTIYPDGGVARLRVRGEVVPDPRRLGGRLDLAASLTDIGTELLPRTRLQPDTEHYLR